MKLRRREEEKRSKARARTIISGRLEIQLGRYERSTRKANTRIPGT